MIKFIKTLNYIFVMLLFFSILGHSNPNDCKGHLSGLAQIDQTSKEVIEIKAPFGNLCAFRCESGYKNISLYASVSDFYNKGARNTVLRSEAEARVMEESSEIKRAFTFNSVQSLRDAILHLNSQCYRIKKMIVASHGDKGYVHIDEKSELSVYNVNELNGISCAFASDAEIIFTGCSVGNGLLGEGFVNEFGKRVLWERGGTVEAANFYTSTLPSLFGKWLPRVSLDGKTRVFTFDAKTKKGKMSDGFVPLNQQKLMAIERMKKIGKMREECKDQDEVLEKAYNSYWDALIFLQDAEWRGNMEDRSHEDKLELARHLRDGDLYLNKAESLCD